MRTSDVRLTARRLAVARAVLLLAFVAVDEAAIVAGWREFARVNENQLHVVRPWNDPDIPSLSLVTGLWIPVMFYWGLNQFITQRTLAAGSLAEGQKGLFFAAWIVLQHADDPSKEDRHPLSWGKDEFAIDRIPSGDYSALLREDVVKPEKEKAFYGGESINPGRDTFERETPLGEVKIRAGEAVALEVLLPELAK